MNDDILYFINRYKYMDILNDIIHQDKLDNLPLPKTDRDTYTDTVETALPIPFT